ncbi:MAG: DUF4309 domain-containing protein [Bacillus sp. (in: firmicutes)]
MKPYIYICLVVLGLTVMIINTINKNEKQKDLEINKVSKQTEEKRDVNWVRENALYEWDLKEGNKEYAAYLVADQEKKYTLKEANTLGNEEDPILEGKFSFYLANEKDNVFAYKQTVEMEDYFVFNLMNKNNDTFYVNKHTIAAILQQTAPDETRLYMYTIKNGKLMYIKESGLSIYKNRIKNIEQNYLQTVTERDKKVFEITTWILNAKEMNLEMLDNTIVQDNRAIENWVEKEAYYPFKNLSIGSSVMSKAKEGMLIGSQYPIGTTSNEIKKSNENYIQKEVDKDTIALIFPEVTYHYDKNNELVTAIEIPGTRLKETMDNVREALGEPDLIVNKKDKGAIATYHAGKYELKMDINHAELIETVELRKK